MFEALKEQRRGGDGGLGGGSHQQPSNYCPFISKEIISVMEGGVSFSACQHSGHVADDDRKKGRGVGEETKREI